MNVDCINCKVCYFDSLTPSRVEAATGSIGGHKVVRGESAVLQAVNEDPNKEMDKDCIGERRQASQWILFQHPHHCGRSCIQDAACKKQCTQTMQASASYQRASTPATCKMLRQSTLHGSLYVY